MKTLKLFLCGILFLGAALINQACAQADLDVNNNTSCTVSIVSQSENAGCNPVLLYTNSVGSGTTNSVTGNTVGYIFQVDFFIGSSLIGSVGDCVSGTCGLNPPCINNITYGTCGTLNLTFVPATSTSNALLTIN